MDVDVTNVIQLSGDTKLSHHQIARIFWQNICILMCISIESQLLQRERLSMSAASVATALDLLGLQNLSVGAMTIWHLYDYLSGAPGDGAIRYPPFLFGIFETPWTDLHPRTPKNRHPTRVHEGQIELTVEYAWLIVFNDRLDFNDVGSFHVDVSDGWTECHDMDHSRPSRLPIKNKLQFIPPNP